MADQEVGTRELLSSVLSPIEVAQLLAVGHVPGDYTVLVVHVSPRQMLVRHEDGVVVLQLVVSFRADMLSAFVGASLDVQQTRRVLTLGLPPEVRVVLPIDALTAEGQEMVAEYLSQRVSHE